MTNEVVFAGGLGSSGFMGFFAPELGVSWGVGSVEVSPWKPDELMEEERAPLDAIHMGIP